MRNSAKVDAITKYVCGVDATFCQITADACFACRYVPCSIAGSLLLTGNTVSKMTNDWMS